MKKKSAKTGLTELEGNVLAVVWRNQPTTAYKLRHSFSESPVGELALSQGSIYPLIERLKKRGYVKAVASGDARQTEHLSCTKEGEGAVAAWLFDMPAMVPPDPLRSRIVSLAALSGPERSRWVAEARVAVSQTIAAIEEFAEAYRGPYFDMAHDNARSIALARLKWLDRVETNIASLPKGP